MLHLMLLYTRDNDMACKVSDPHTTSLTVCIAVNIIWFFLMGVMKWRDCHMISHTVISEFICRYPTYMYVFSVIYTHSGSVRI